MFEGTTILTMRKGERVVMAGDGQVTFGGTVLKGNAVKVRRFHEGRILAGFAGSTADAFSLFEKFEVKLKEYNGNLLRSAVELAKDWRTDRALRHLEAMLLVADAENTLIISGKGDVVEPADGLASIGSGGAYALAAARALRAHSDLDLRDAAEAAMRIAAEICIYTNDQLVVEEI